MKGQHHRLVPCFCPVCPFSLPHSSAGGLFFLIWVSPFFFYCTTAPKDPEHVMNIHKYSWNSTSSSKCTCTPRQSHPSVEMCSDFKCSLSDVTCFKIGWLQYDISAAHGKRIYIGNHTKHTTLSLVCRVNTWLLTVTMHSMWLNVNLMIWKWS